MHEESSESPTPRLRVRPPLDWLAVCGILALVLLIVCAAIGVASLFGILGRLGV